MARYIGFRVFKNGGDIRGVMSVGKLIRKGGVDHSVIKRK
jgi:hypothetical protein